MNGLGFMNAVYATSSDLPNLDIVKYETVVTKDSNTKQNETPTIQNNMSVILHINQKDSKWKQDNIDKQYMSKTYNVTANADIRKYKVIINADGVKITNNQNQEKSEFAANEEFKVLVPIKNMEKVGTFKIEVKRTTFI